ncbi:unnamed protein product [Bursaphelenchus okinawaensis]|uniref:Uncharacterized protein n=1 Tax=Bursaphelenchus okinawaensis TaxID=465554 RepID=A0A811LM19_9BILA|nr:unnamed protein product [Bursaphelenchus okinawaensis]CAG9123919.1 unnamed protein product [Bursaphelenchus okinawaensis]
MLNHTTDVEDKCSFAQINKYCYRLAVLTTNMDFKSLCYRSSVCRYDGETWAEAFLNAPSRPMEQTYKAEFGKMFVKDSKCCPYTGTLRVILNSKQILLTNIDFGKKLHDLSFTLYYRDGTLVDLYNQKEYQVEATKTVGVHKVHICNADLYGHRRYVGYVNNRKEFVLINNDTGEAKVIFAPVRLFYCDNKIKIVDNMELVSYRDQMVQVCNIVTKECVFESLDPFHKIPNIKNDDGIQFKRRSSNTLLAKLKPTNSDNITLKYRNIYNVTADNFIISTLESTTP